MVEPVVLVAFIGLVATIVSGTVGALGQPWMTARITKDRDKRDRAHAAEERTRALVLDTLGAMRDILQHLHRARAQTPHIGAGEAQDRAREAHLLFASLAPTLPDADLRARASAFDEGVRPAVYASTYSYPTDEMRALFDRFAERAGVVIRDHPDPS